MRTSPIRIVTAAIAVAGLAATAQAGPRAVVELFTSQGCPSCPPADALLTKLARDPDLIALSLPVDYFDQPGLKEKLSRHAFTERQEAYANARGDDDLYTPQAIVNGREQAFGSERPGDRGCCRRDRIEPARTGRNRARLRRHRRCSGRRCGEQGKRAG